MGSVTVLCKRDPRIDELIMGHIRSSKPLAYYLIRALRDHNGSFHTARILLKALRQFDTNRDVRVEGIERLGVHARQEFMPRLYEALKVHVPDLINQTVTLALHLRVCTSQEKDIRIFLNIFQCTIAMMIGLKIDPRIG